MTAAVGELAARVIERIGDPIDRWAVAVELESAGLGAPDSETPSLFALADEVFAECLRRRAGRPEVTVAMPAYNRGPLIGEAIRSVLAQEGIELELIVVDDGSDDDTAAVVASFQDPRVRLLRNPTNRGISYCHDRIVAASRAPFIAHVDSDDTITAGALRRLVDRLAASADFGQAHGFGVPMTADGRLELASFRRDRARVMSARPANLDYRRALLRTGSVMNPLRVYRREVFDVAGGFDQERRHGSDLHMALRILETHEIVHVREVVYLVRQHSGRVTHLPFVRLRFWFERVAMVGSLLRRRAISYPRRRPYRPAKLFALDLGGALGVARSVSAARKGLDRWKLRVGRGLLGAARSTAAALYRMLVRALERWPAPPRVVASPGPGPPRIAYFLWQYPIASHTFLQRELGALARSGAAVVVVAEQSVVATARPVAVDDDAPRRALTLDDVDRRQVGELVRRRLGRRPWSLLSLGLWLLGIRHGRVKSWREDLLVLDRAVRLAVLLERERVTRVHAPWADRTALIARLAAAICRLPYSVQARAHELQREGAQVGLRERLAGAEVIICAAGFARDLIASVLGEPLPPIQVVPEGLDPRRFRPPRRDRPGGGPARVLTVARLVEEKGILELLAAAAELRDRGVDFRWRVVGGAEEPYYTNYLLEVRRRHRRLRLEDRVLFAGEESFEQVLAEYAWADLFVLPCVEAANGGKDMTPNVLLEAMAMELPVVSTRQTAIPELVEDGGSGVLVDAGDTPALAEAIARLLASPELRRQLGERGRACVEERFDLDRNTRLLLRSLGGEPAAVAVEG